MRHIDRFVAGRRGRRRRCIETIKEVRAAGQFPVGTDGVTDARPLGMTGRKEEEKGGAGGRKAQGGEVHDSRFFANVEKIRAKGKSAGPAAFSVIDSESMDGGLTIYY